MIIAFSGSHCTGKSILVSEFKKNKNFVCLDSVTRSTISAKERRVDGVEDLEDTQNFMADKVLENMVRIVNMNIEDPSKVYLMDRSVFDFLGYTKCFMDRGLLSTQAYVGIWNKCKDVWNNIDFFFFLRPDFPIVDDGVRSIDEDLRQKVDQEIYRLLKETGVAYEQLTGSVEDRVNTVLNHVKCSA